MGRPPGPAPAGSFLRSVKHGYGMAQNCPAARQRNAPCPAAGPALPARGSLRDGRCRGNTQGGVGPAGRGVTACGSSGARRCGQWIAPVAHVAGREPDTRCAGMALGQVACPLRPVPNPDWYLTGSLGAKPECSGLQGLRHGTHGGDRCRSQASKFPGERRDGVLSLRSGDIRCRGADPVQAIGADRGGHLLLSGGSGPSPTGVAERRRWQGTPGAAKVGARLFPLPVSGIPRGSKRAPPCPSPLRCACGAAPGLPALVTGIATPDKETRNDPELHQI